MIRCLLFFFFLCGPEEEEEEAAHVSPTTPPMTPLSCRVSYMRDMSFMNDSLSLRASGHSLLSLELVCLFANHPPKPRQLKCNSPSPLQDTPHDVVMCKGEVGGARQCGDLLFQRKDNTLNSPRLAIGFETIGFEILNLPLELRWCAES